MIGSLTDMKKMAQQIVSMESISTDENLLFSRNLSNIYCFYKNKLKL